MKTISVDITETKKSYEIEFPLNFDELLKDLNTQIDVRNFLIITDENIFKLFKDHFFSHFDEDKILVIPAGETEKNFATVEKILNKAFKNKLDRSSLFVAVGGGVVGDMTGFAASLFMRGTPFIQIPTSLLAMVDASVGGKTGIDNEYGKNLVGAFHQPEKIYCCREFLSKLPKVEIQNGLAEMVKHGVLASVQHFADLKALSTSDDKFLVEKIFPLVQDSIEIKKSIVEQDEKEAGIRAHLNLGHTFGHAIELLSDFKIPHGLGVAIGTVKAAEFSVLREFCNEEVVKEIKEVFTNFEMDLTCNFPNEDIFRAMERDKKVRHGKINLVLPTKIGEVMIYELDS
ncbi:MAG: 3-dehydroquinate synthase [Candidatus Peregrinibacteria bacterium]|nr:3-dehydroquinate synthase [Candidatus Peregrinibacteria bacterium]